MTQRFLFIKHDRILFTVLSNNFIHNVSCQDFPHQTEASLLQSLLVKIITVTLQVYFSLSSSTGNRAIPQKDKNAGSKP
jgi:hypothetical protein